MPERDAAEARDIRDRTIEFVVRHDRDCHDGEACRENRIGILAFLAHAVGISSAEVVTGRGDPGPAALELADALVAYEANHRWHIAGHNGSGPHA